MRGLTVRESSCPSDQKNLLAFYDFPAEHVGHLRTTNPFESSFSRSHLRHRRTKGSGLRKARAGTLQRQIFRARGPTNTPDPQHIQRF
jgi:transposase-like protein